MSFKNQKKCIAVHSSEQTWSDHREHISTEARNIRKICCNSVQDSWDVFVNGIMWLLLTFPVTCDSWAMKTASCPVNCRQHCSRSWRRGKTSWDRRMETVVEVGILQRLHAPNNVQQCITFFCLFIMIVACNWQLHYRPGPLMTYWLLPSL